MPRCGRSACPCRRTCCFSWSARRWPCYVIENLNEASATASRLAQPASIGRWGKPGIYDWTPDGEPYVSDEAAKLLVVGDRPSTAEQVRERALERAGREIGLMLTEVVAAPMDVDLCLILGAGWPFHLGGITPYLDRECVSERVLGRRFLPPESPQSPSLTPSCQNPADPAASVGKSRRRTEPGWRAAVLDERRKQLQKRDSTGF